MLMARLHGLGTAISIFPTGANSQFPITTLPTGGGGGAGWTTTTPTQNVTSWQLPPQCPTGQVWDPASSKCVQSQPCLQTRACPTGSTWDCNKMDCVDTRMCPLCPAGMTMGPPPGPCCVPMPACSSCDGGMMVCGNNPQPGQTCSCKVNGWQMQCIVPPPDTSSGGGGGGGGGCFQTHACTGGTHWDCAIGDCVADVIVSPPPPPPTDGGGGGGGGGGFVLDPNGFTCLSTSLLSNGLCPGSSSSQPTDSGGGTLPPAGPGVVVTSAPPVPVIADAGFKWPWWAPYAGLAAAAGIVLGFVLHARK